MSVSIDVPLNDVLQTVERPVIFDILRQLQQKTLIPNNVPIRFYGEDAKAAQFNSTLTKDTTTDNLWPHQENLTIEVDEDHDPDNALSMAVKYQDNQYIFQDEDLNVIIRPAYSKTQVTVRVLYKAVDKNRATKWRNAIRTRFAMMRDSFMHDATYSYHVPAEFLVILQEIHRLRENVAPYGDTLQDWMSQHFSTRATQVSNQTGEDSFLAISEKQTQIQGFFNFDFVPEKAAREDEPNLWVTSFEYKFTYDKPISAVMNYPIMVHQQILSAQFRPTETVPSYYSVLKQFSYSWQNFTKFTCYNQAMQYLGNKGLSIPPYDNFVLNGTPVTTVRAALILLSLSQQDPYSLANLSQLGDFNLSGDILDFMKASEYAFMGVPYASIFQLHHYQDGRIQFQDGLVIDNQLNVSLAQAADLRKQYRLRLSLVTSFDFLPSAAIARLRAVPAVACRVLTAINASIRNLSNQPDIPRARLTPKELNLFGCMYDSNGLIVPGYSTIGIDLNSYLPFGGLVESLYVIASRNTSKG